MRDAARCLLRRPHTAAVLLAIVAAAVLEFERHLALVEQVQAGQLAVARFLVEQLALAGVYQEGLTHASVPDWNLRLGPDWPAAYDDETDGFIFRLPGATEPRRFKPLVVDPDRGDTKVWAVIGTFSANDPNSGDQP
jgi:hypothetical protein